MRNGAVIPLYKGRLQQIRPRNTHQLYDVVRLRRGILRSFFNCCMLTF